MIARERGGPIRRYPAQEAQLGLGDPDGVPAPLAEENPLETLRQRRNHQDEVLVSRGGRGLRAYDPRFLEGVHADERQDLSDARKEGLGVGLVDLREGRCPRLRGVQGLVTPPSPRPRDERMREPPPDAAVRHVTVGHEDDGAFAELPVHVVHLQALPDALGLADTEPRRRLSVSSGPVGRWTPGFWSSARPAACRRCSRRTWRHRPVQKLVPTIRSPSGSPFGTKRRIVQASGTPSSTRSKVSRTRPSRRGVDGPRADDSRGGPARSRDPAPVSGRGRRSKRSGVP